jgi:small subunit ribosomal protein S2
MREITLEELLEAGCHFGHQVIRSNPKARDFVFEAREGIQIIDLAKTKEGLDAAAAFVSDLGKRGGSLLVVSTKRQAKDTVEDLVKKTREDIKAKETSEKLFYVTSRWIGGTLTNFGEVSKNLKKLADLKEKLTSEEERGKYTKKEIGLWDKERAKLEGIYAGLSGMTKEPDALFIIDSHLEELAVKEALSRGVETVAIVDTNADPFVIDWPIPANDDAVGSISLIVGHIMDAYAQGLKSQKQETPDKGKEDAPKKEAKPKEEKPKKKSSKETKTKTKVKKEKK